MKVKFDLKYRQQIESGEYKVETADGRQVRIICWDVHNLYRENDIVALATSSSGEGENILRYYSNGHLISDSANIGNKDLIVVIPDEDERIRKDIVALIKFALEDGSAVSPGSHTTKEEALAYLERQKEPHYTKRNELFDQCVANCDPEVMKEVSDNVDEMLRKEQKSDGWGKATINGEPIPAENQSVDIPLAEWSQKDKNMLLSIINAFRNGAVSTIGQEQWLKSLPERFNLRPKEEWSEDKYPKNIENAATMFCFDNGLNITPHQAVMIAKHFYELGFKRMSNGRA